jgi:hypothetical protein
MLTLLLLLLGAVALTDARGTKPTKVVIGGLFAANEDGEEIESALSLHSFCSRLR